MRVAVLAPFLLLFAGQCLAQDKFVIGTNGDYSILINGKIENKSVKTKTDGYIDYYILKQSNTLIYMLTVTRVGGTQTSDVIYTDSFRTSFLKECGCHLLDYKRTRFNNFAANIMKIDSKLNEKYFSGFSVATVSSGVLYNITFLALQDKISSLEPEFKKLLNSLVFK